MNEDSTREVLPLTHPSKGGRAALATSAMRLLVGTALSLSLLAVWAGSAQATQSPIPAAGFPQTNPAAAVSAIAVAPDGDTVYVGGDFTTFGGQTRTKLAAFSLSTGTVLPWNPTVSGGNQFIDQIVATNTDVYVAGSFNSISGTARQGIAKIGASGSGTLDDTWNPTMGVGEAFAIALSADGAALFIGGSFSTIGGASRANIAKLSTSGTGAADGSWNPGATGGSNPYVTSLLVSGNDLYVGGGLTTIGGQTRNGLAKVSASGSGTVDPSWNPNVSSSSHFVRSMALSGSSLYVGGTFTTIGGQTRSNLAKVSATGTGAVDSTWAPLAGSNVYGLTMLNDQVYVAGDFFTIAGAARNYLAALDPTTGTATSWYPNPGGPSGGFSSISVRSLAIAGTTVIAGGNFQTFGVGDNAMVSYGLALLKDILPPDNTEPPSIAGTPTYKQTLVCNKGTWTSPGATVDYSYQWKRGDAPIGQALGSSYTVTTDDYGEQLSCAVTASNLGGSTSKTSAPVLASEPAAVPTGGDSGAATVPRVRTRILSNLSQLLRHRKLTLKVGCNTSLSTRITVFTTGIRQIRLASARVSCDRAGSQEVVAKVRKAARNALKRAIGRADLQKVEVRIVARVTGAEPSRARGVLRLAG